MGNGRWDFANIYDQGGKCKVSKKGVGDVYGRVFGGSMSLLGVTWADIWGPLGVAGELLGVLGRLGGALGRLWEGLRRLHGLFGGHLGGHWVSFGGRWWASGGSWAAWWGHGGAEIRKYSYLRSKNTPCNQVNGCKYPPGMHRGCTEDAPRMLRVSN